MDSVPRLRETDFILLLRSRRVILKRNKLRTLTSKISGTLRNLYIDWWSLWKWKFFIMKRQPLLDFRRVSCCDMSGNELTLWVNPRLRWIGCSQTLDLSRNSALCTGRRTHSSDESLQRGSPFLKSVTLLQPGAFTGSSSHGLDMRGNSIQDLLPIEILMAWDPSSSHSDSLNFLLV